MAKIKALACEVGKKARVIEIDTELDELQKFVGGYIETFYPFGDELCCIVNDEGKFTKEMNRPVYYKGQLCDILCGDFLCVNAPSDSEDFASITDEQLRKCKRVFGNPSVFMKIGGQVLVL